MGAVSGGCRERGETGAGAAAAVATGRGRGRGKGAGPNKGEKRIREVRFHWKDHSLKSVVDFETGERPDWTIRRKKRERD